MHLKIVVEKISNGYIAELTVGERKVSYGQTAQETATLIAKAAAEWADKEDAEAARTA